MLVTTQYPDSLPAAVSLPDGLHFPIITVWGKASDRRLKRNGGIGRHNARVVYQIVP